MNQDYGYGRGFADVLGQYSDVAQAEALAQERLRKELLEDQRFLVQQYKEPEAQAGASIGFNLMRGFAEGLGLGPTIDDDPLVKEARATREALSGLQSIKHGYGTSAYFDEAARLLAPTRPDLSMQMLERKQQAEREVLEYAQSQAERLQERQWQQQDIAAKNEYASGMAMSDWNARVNQAALEAQTQERLLGLELAGRATEGNLDRDSAERIAAANAAGDAAAANQRRFQQELNNFKVSFENEKVTDDSVGVTMQGVLQSDYSPKLDVYVPVIREVLNRHMYRFGADQVAVGATPTTAADMPAVLRYVIEKLKPQLLPEGRSWWNKVPTDLKADDIDPIVREGIWKVATNLGHTSPELQVGAGQSGAPIRVLRVKPQQK